MKLEKFIEQLKTAYGSKLQSIVLFGSAAAGDFQPGRSDYNVMVVLSDITPGALAQGAPLIRRWMKAGNPAPLLIDPQHIKSSKDVFPIEFSDMLEAHQILFGDSPLTGLVIDREQLRLQCESEIKQKILMLRERYVELYPSKRRLRKLMLRSFSSFLAIFRGYLRLKNLEVPKTKQAVLSKLNEATDFDTGVLERILAARTGERKIAGAKVLSLFAEYLTSLEKIATVIDQL